DVGRYISQAVLVGFTFGAATLIFMGQMQNVLGVPAAASTRILDQIVDVVRSAPLADPPALAVAALTFAILWGSARVSPAIPAAMIAVGASAGVVAALGWSEGPAPIPLVAEIPAVPPRFTWPAFDFGLLEDVIGSSAAIAVLGMVESISIGKAVSSQARI